jgi:ElaB/YqjD/DUF883 family membrane-anchored ribosome-binding protein
VPLKKPSDFFNKKPNFNDVNSLSVKISEEKFNNVFDVFNNYKGYLNDFEDKLNTLNSLSEQVVLLKDELQKTIKKEDLDSSIFSQLLYVNEAISNIENNVKTINEEKLSEIREDTGFLLKKVENFIDKDIPKYKKNLVDFEIRTDSRIEDLIGQKISPINESVSLIQNNVEDQLIEIGKRTLDIQKVKNEVYESIQSIENLLGEETNANNIELQKIKLESRKKFEEIQENLKKITDVVLVETTSNLNAVVQSITENKSIDDQQDKRIEYIESYLKNSALGSFKKTIFDKVVRIESEVVINENRIKKQTKELETIQKEIYDTIQDLKIYDIIEENKNIKVKVRELEELYESIENKTSKQLLNEEVPPESVKTEDPLTPLDQKFVTLDQLQEHYRVFINRVQQQLASLGGGGETRLQYLDDIVGIATNPSAYDGKYLKYNHAIKKFEFTDVDITNDAWADGVDGPFTLAQVGIGTTAIETSPYPGNSLLVYGNARVTGILSIGTASITLDPESGSIKSGEVQLVNSDGSANYTGIITALGYIGTGTSSIFSDVSATSFSGDGSNVTNIQGSNIHMQLGQLEDIDTSNLTGISTDYLMVYDPSISGFKFVNPKTYFGINNDYNSDPNIDDFGTYETP